MSEVTDLKDSIELLKNSIDKQVKGSGGGGSGGGPNTPTTVFDKIETGLSAFYKATGKASVALSGMVAMGLRNTVEGYKLGLAFDRLAYQFANSMKGPIDTAISAINQIAAEFNFLNSIPLVRSIMGWTGGILLGVTAIAGLVSIFTPLCVGFTALASAMGVATLSLLGYAAIIAAAIAAAPFVYHAGEEAGKASHEWVRDKQAALYESTGINVGQGKERADRAKQMGYGNWAEAKKAQADDKFNNWINGMSQHDIAQDMIKHSKKDENGLYQPESTEDWTKRKRKEFDADPKQKDKQKDIPPMYQTAFTGLTALWENMNKQVTENPGLEIAKSGIEAILVKLGIIADNTADDGPQPRAAGAVGP